MKRVIIWGWSIGSMSVAIDQLIEDKLIEVVLWITPQNVKSRRPKYFSYVPEVMLKEQAALEKRSDALYKNDSEQLNKDLCKFMDIYSRVNFSKGLDYHEHVNLFHLYYSYFSNILLTEKVDTVLHMGAPHVGVDYVLYLAAQAHGIQNILTFQSHIRDRFFCTTKLEDYGIFRTSPVPGQPVSEKIPQEFKKHHYYMVNAKHKRGLRPHKFFEEAVRAVIPTRQPISWAGVFQNAANRINYVRYYNKHVVKTVDYKKKYVYFPLQLQPELTTSALGNEYADQLLAIEKISAMLPEDWCIYVKENPKQSAAQRNRFFFERLARIRNCFYLSENINTYELIEHSQFVSAITGTVCWEAISGGKTALVFGVSWFMTLPGVIIYRPDLTLEEVIEVQFTHEELELAYNKLMSKTIPGIIGLEYSISKKSEEELINEKRVLKFFREVLT